MTGGTRIVAIGQGSEEPAPIEETTAAPADSWQPDDWDELAPPARSRGWILPTFALLAIAGWTGFYVWANQSLLGGVTPQEGIFHITSWAMPVLLICMAWLILLRTSRREAMRFGDAARLLSEESQRLEQRLTAVNRELSLAREFLASQSRELDSLGRVATEKLSHHAERLQGLIRDNGAQVDAIAGVSTHALDNMEKLRGQLPVIASSAKDVANNIGNAGRTAHTQLSDMVEGFNRLNEFGKASEIHVDSLKQRIDTVIEFLGQRLDDLRERAEQRFAALEGKTGEMRAQLASNEDEALAAIRTRAAALMDELSATRDMLDSHEVESLSLLRTRLGALREESASLAGTLREGEDAAMAALEQSRRQLDASVRETLERLHALDRQAVEAARSRIAALSQEAEGFDARLAERNRHFAEETERRTRQANEDHEAQMARIEAHLASFEEQVARHRASSEGHVRSVGESGDAILARLDEAGRHIADIAAKAGEAEGALGASLSSLSSHISGSRDAIGDMHEAMARLTHDSVRLLELLQASARQGRSDLPEALATSEGKLVEFESRIADLQDGIARAATRSEEVAVKVADTRGAIGQTLGEIGALQSGLEQGAARHAGKLDELRTALEQLDADSRRLSGVTTDELASALERLTHATRDALAAFESAGNRTIAGIADKLGEESGAVVERVLRQRTADAVGALDEAADRAAAGSREAAIQLRDQLAKIDELTGNLERRVARAREQAEDQVDSDFSRRVALITESLNSNAIDIAKALSSDVTDTAWASYLRGDRGVFTRRAVRLLDNQEARSIARIYGEDGEFREQVARYIHDFEAMLRQLLSTRDGHALSVTLLSSDMGKLYVALAQAIERLRE